MLSKQKQSQSSDEIFSSQKPKNLKEKKTDRLTSFSVDVNDNGVDNDNVNDNDVDNVNDNVNDNGVDKQTGYSSFLSLSQKPCRFWCRAI